MKILLSILTIVSLLVSQVNVSVYTTSRKGKVGEFEEQLMTEIFKLYESKFKTKVNLTFSPLATFSDGFDRIKEAGAKEVCVINSVTMTDERKAMYNFSPPYIPVQDAILTLASKNYSDKNVWKKKGTKIAYTPGTTGEAIVKALEKKHGVKGMPFENRTERIAALKDGKTDFAVGDNILAWDDSSLAVLDEIEGGKTGYFGIIFSQNSKIKKNFDSIFKYYIKSPNFRKLTTNIFGNQITTYFKKNL